jgi:predicted DNA-binding transcriptional regulator AlpA
MLTTHDNSMPGLAVPPDEHGAGALPLLLSAEDAAALLGIGRSLFYGLHSSGRLGPLPVHLGKRSLWRRDELIQWVSSDCPPRQRWQEFKGAQR